MINHLNFNSLQIKIRSSKSINKTNYRQKKRNLNQSILLHWLYLNSLVSQIYRYKIYLCGNHATLRVQLIIKESDKDKVDFILKLEVHILVNWLKEFLMDMENCSMGQVAQPMTDIGNMDNFITMVKYIAKSKDIQINLVTITLTIQSKFKLKISKTLF